MVQFIILLLCFPNKTKQNKLRPAPCVSHRQHVSSHVRRGNVHVGNAAACGGVCKSSSLCVFCAWGCRIDEARGRDIIAICTSSQAVRISRRSTNLVPWKAKGLQRLDAAARTRPRTGGLPVPTGLHDPGPTVPSCPQVQRARTRA